MRAIWMAEEKRRLARQARDASCVLASQEEEELEPEGEEEQPAQSQKGTILDSVVFGPILINVQMKKWQTRLRSSKMLRWKHYYQ